MEFVNKRLLITGAAGTIGQALIRKLVQMPSPPEEILALDCDEKGVFFLNEKYKNESYVTVRLCNILDEYTVNRYMKGINYVVHAAALKHVILSEYSPTQAVNTNILGTQSVIKAAETNKVEKFIFTSSDKAVNPTSVMGTSKLMGERLVTAANVSDMKCKFLSTRFGNVLGSNGSVLEIFKEQIKNSKHLTLTHKEMTRFIMSEEQAAQLVLSGFFIGLGGEVLITKMQAVRILDLARALMNIYSKQIDVLDEGYIEEIGIKPGEKLYEELMTDEEKPRSIELDNFFSVAPTFEVNKNEYFGNYREKKHSLVTETYNSTNQRKLSVKEIEDLLVDFNLV